MQEMRNPGMQDVVLVEKSLADYEPVVGEDIIAELHGLADPFQGARVLHISSTAYGGGVAEMLHTLIPLMRSAGLDAHWKIISGTDEFFAVTKSMHNALQGMELELTPAMKAAYLHSNVENAVYFENDYDFIIVHDPQPAPLRMLRAGDGGKWIWRCHIDLTAANETYWSFLRPYVQAYDAAIFTMPEYVKKDLRIGKVAIVPPAIDPLSPKNAPMSDEDAARIVSLYGMDPERPMLVQVSRFDPWKDPLGVIDVYRAVRQKFPDVQLVMVGSMAHDDPEGMEYYQRTKDYADGDPDIHLLSNIDGVGNVEVNAIQRMATVVLQKSLREGFGLTISEGSVEGQTGRRRRRRRHPAANPGWRDGLSGEQHRGMQQARAGADAQSDAGAQDGRAWPRGGAPELPLDGQPAQLSAALHRSDAGEPRAPSPLGGIAAPTPLPFPY